MKELAPVGAFAVTSVYFKVNFEVDYKVEVEWEVNYYVRIIKNVEISVTCLKGKESSQLFLRFLRDHM